MVSHKKKSAQFCYVKYQVASLRYHSLKLSLTRGETMSDVKYQVESPFDKPIYKIALESLNLLCIVKKCAC